MLMVACVRDSCTSPEPRAVKPTLHTMNAILLAIAAGLCGGIGEVATRSDLHSGKVGLFAAIAFRTTIALPLIWAAWIVARRFSKLEARGFADVDGTAWLKLILGSRLVAGAAAMIFFYAACRSVRFRGSRRLRLRLLRRPEFCGVGFCWANR